MVLTEFITDYLGVCHKSETYKAALKNTGQHIERFAAMMKTQIQTNMSEQEIENFVYYLREQKLMSSTVKNNLGRLKYLLSKASQWGHKINATINDFNIKDEEVNTIFLTMSEILKIHRFQNLTAREIEIKDYFLIGCLTALRFSDYSRLQKKNFVGNKIVVRTKKTNTPVQVPMHPIVKEIVLKYNRELPAAPTIQHFNREIKIICKKIGFARKMPYERQIGTERISVMRPKYQFISSHTARRSAATNMYLAKIQPYRIMLITGHKTEKSFFRYIRITREENVKVLARHPFFRAEQCKKRTSKNKRKTPVSA